mgnify:CR=1 FL=1
MKNREGPQNIRDKANVEGMGYNHNVIAWAVAPYYDDYRYAHSMNVIVEILITILLPRPQRMGPRKRLPYGYQPHRPRPLQGLFGLL